MTGVVDGCGGVIHGAHQRELVSVLGHAREDFANLDAGDVGRDGLVGSADFRGRVRLHVPGVKLAGSPDQEQHDAVHVLVGIDGAERLQTQKIAHAQPQESERARVQKVAPGHSIAEVNRLVSVQPVHRSASSKGTNRPRRPRTKFCAMRSPRSRISSRWARWNPMASGLCSGGGVLR